VSTINSYIILCKLIIWEILKCEFMLMFHSNCNANNKYFFIIIKKMENRIIFIKLFSEFI